MYTARPNLRNWYDVQIVHKAIIKTKNLGKTVNSMFSFQMLILMANGFMNLTAQFFFVYCGRVDQVQHLELTQF